MSIENRLIELRLTRPAPPAVAGFADSAAVINGVSDLLVLTFGEVGRHARAAVAVAGLPGDATVEVQVLVEAKG